MGDKIHRMTMGQKFALFELVRSRYEEKDLTDGQFAEWATKELKIECLSHAVKAVRTELRIESTYDRRARVHAQEKLNRANARAEKINGQGPSVLERLERAELQIIQLMEFCTSRGMK